MTEADEVKRLLGSIKSMSHEDMANTLALLDELEDRKRTRLARMDFLAFIAAVDPAYKFGVHLKRLGALLMQVEDGGKDRIAVSMAPRFGKSQMISIYYPAWYLGKHPDHKMIVASHTVDLAVDMARKVRNLMQTAEYKSIFPGVAIAADAKAAGKWNTTKGGEVYATGVGGALAGRGAHLCLTPATSVETLERGFVPCGTVQVGESLRSWHGWAKVLKRITPEHSATVTVAGRLDVSAAHPIWTCNRGWVPAIEVVPTDILWTTSVCDKIRTYLQGAADVLTAKAWDVQYPGLQHMGDDGAALHKPQNRQLHKLWGCGHNSVGAVARLFCVLRGYWASTYTEAYAGSHRQFLGVQPGQLQVGGRRDPAEQSNQRGAYNGVWGDAIRSTVGAANWANRRYDTPSYFQHGDDVRAGATSTQNESQYPTYYPVELGWLRRAGVHLLSRCGSLSAAKKLRNREEGYLVRPKAGLQVIAGFLLGVRLAGATRIDRHEARPFINFMVDGDNTFVADTILTHNCIIDDPISEQDIKSGNTTSLDGVYDWFRNGLRTRLMPGGKICILHCLTGDTQVALANGTDCPLRDVRPGDMVASYDNGTIRPAKVLGWSNQGSDHIYAITLRSGVTIRGNERHPLLVSQNGTTQWIKIKGLKPGMHLVCATNPDARSPYIPGVNASTTTTRPAEKPQKALHLPVGGNGGVRLALRIAATIQHTQRVFASHVVTKLFMRSEKPVATTTARKNGVTHILKCGTGSLEASTIADLLRKPEPAQYAGSLHTMRTPQQHGKFVDWLLTTATLPVKFVRFCVIRAISLLKRETPPSYCAKPLSTLSITLDEIVSIAPDGVEDVFDIQVEGTESFLANGVVSHNTRWHQRDLIGRLVKDGSLNEDGDQYEIFEFPAIIERKNPLADLKNEGFDPDAPATLQKSLWPEQWSLESLLRTKASMPAWQWNAQYQQNPTAQEAAIIKRDNIKWWPKEDPPAVDFIVQAFDTALTTNTRSDYSVCQTWGVWKNEDGVDNVILLNRVKGKWEFPELKQMALQQAKEWSPDSVIVEAKASGQPLIDEMRRSGLFVQDYSPGKGQDKIARMNSVSDMFMTGQVWFPETSWATEVVEEILAFPSGEHDDEVDTMTLALMRIRKGGLLRLSTDHEDNTDYHAPRKAAYY